MDIDKPVTARQLAWILWGPAVAIGLLALIIYIAAETRVAPAQSAAESAASLKVNTETLERHIRELDALSGNASGTAPTVP